MRLLIERPGAKDACGEWVVWAGLDVDDDPRVSVEGFCIGVGLTRNEAVTGAVQALEEAVEALQSPPGVVEEADPLPFVPQPF